MICLRRLLSVCLLLALVGCPLVAIASSASPPLVRPLTCLTYSISIPPRLNN